MKTVLPTKAEARALLTEHVSDTYQRFHAEMVGRAVEGYAEKLRGRMNAIKSSKTKERPGRDKEKAEK